MSACKDGSTLGKISSHGKRCNHHKFEKRGAALKATRIGDTTPYSAPPREATAKCRDACLHPEGREDEWRARRITREI